MSRGSLARKVLVPPRDVIEVRLLAETDDPRGRHYGKILAPSGAAILVVSFKLNSAQLYRRGKEDTVVRYKMFAEISEEGRITDDSVIWHPEYSGRDEVGDPVWDDRPLKVVSAVPLRGRDQLLQFEAEDTS